MSDNRVTIKWQRDYEKYECEVSCISLNPPILHDHGSEDEFDGDTNRWILVGERWHTSIDEACFSFNRALHRALAHFQKQEADLESILLGKDA